MGVASKDELGMKTRRNSLKSRRIGRNFVLNPQETIQGLLTQEDTTKDSRITIEDSGPKKFALRLEGGGVSAIEGTYSISTLLQELSLLDVNIGSVVIPEEIINEDPVRRLTRYIKTCFWDNLKRKLDADGLKLALIDTKIFRLEYFLYVPAGDDMAVAYYREIENTLRKEGFKIKVVLITMSEKIPGALVAADTIKGRQIFCDLYPGLLSLSLRSFEMDPTVEVINCRRVTTDVSGDPINPKIQRNYIVKEVTQPCPFFVPGGRFNEMYGWDSYFIAKGLIHSGKLAEAMCIAENFRYQIVMYGKILNANRSYYLFRGSPPFFPTLICEILEQFTEEEKNLHGEWIQQCVAAMKIEYQYYMKGHAKEVGLTRYTPGGKGVPTETEPGHFRSAIRRYVSGAKNWTDQEADKYIEEYNNGEKYDQNFEKYLLHDKAVRENGHDTTKRIDNLAVDLYTVDLNCLLYKMECDILKFQNDEDIKETMEKRRAAINQYLWDEETGFYYDYHPGYRRRSTYKGAISYYPLFVDAASPRQAEILVRNLPTITGAGGIFTCTKESALRHPFFECLSADEVAHETSEAGHMHRQWDYPYGWAPHQMIIWKGLMNYGYFKEAKDLAFRWCKMLVSVFRDYNGVISEKYDLEQCNHKVYAEYGNVGTDFKFIPKEGFGWTNTSFLVGMNVIGVEGRRRLDVFVGIAGESRH